MWLSRSVFIPASCTSSLFAVCSLLSAGLQPFEMDKRAVFLKFELFAKRLNKLIDMFTTIHQFSSLEQHTHIAGAQSCLLSLHQQVQALPVLISTAL
jgi:hypothetical protein